MEKLGNSIKVIFLLGIRQVSAVEDETQKLPQKSIGSNSVLLTRLAGCLEDGFEVWLDMRIIELETK
jgi:hypothetical protein